MRVLLPEQIQPYAWPGGYTILYLDRHNDILCADCAKESAYNWLAWALTADSRGDSEWFSEPSAPAIAGDIYYEGPTLHCDECNAEIESAYGDPDRKDEE